jgi:multimeric flavodoxin WrbA
MNAVPKAAGPRAFLLAGSPKGLKGTSYELGRCFLGKLEAGGFSAETQAAGAASRSEESSAALLRAVDEADLVVVSFPLYIDQLPAPLIAALERVADDRRLRPARKSSKLMAIVQCGFPESLQNLPAVEIMRRFAKETGFSWAGALFMGMGGALGGKPLAKAGGMARNTVKALDLAAASLLAGGNVPDEASTLMARPLFPRWLYRSMANWGMKREARKHGAKRTVLARPYESAAPDGEC